MFNDKNGRPNALDAQRFAIEDYRIKKLKETTVPRDLTRELEVITEMPDPAYVYVQDDSPEGKAIDISNISSVYTGGNGIIVNEPNRKIAIDTAVVATKTDLTTKQNTLTAGSNITIINDVISSTSDPQVNADWTATSGVAQILHKPNLATVATSGSYTDLTNKPSIPAAQVNADWDATSGVAKILHKPTIPTKTSDLTNDSGFITSSDIPVTKVNGKTGDVVLNASDVGALADSTTYVTTVNGSHGVVNLTAASVGAYAKTETYNKNEIDSSLGSKVDKVTGKQLSTNDFTDSYKANVDANTTHRTAKNNPHEVTKAQVGLGNVDNTSDANKPISVATQIALNNKQNTLTFDNTPTSDSTNPVTSGGIKNYVDYHHDSTKQNTLTAGANITIVNDVISAAGSAQVNADWNATSGVAEILHKPTIPSKTSDLTNDSGFITSSTAPVKSVNSKTGNVTLSASDVGTYTSSEISSRLSAKVDVVAGKGLSTNDFTDNDKNQISINTGNINTLRGNVSNLSTDVSAIKDKIPAEATSSNKLADKDFVNSSINNVTAYYVTKNAQGDAFETHAELMAATTFYSGGVVRVPTRNDYCIVRADETKTTPAGNPTTRYIYQTVRIVDEPITIPAYSTRTVQNPPIAPGSVVLVYNKAIAIDDGEGHLVVGGTELFTINYTTGDITSMIADSTGVISYTKTGGTWQFQYKVNDTALTAAQVAAINSGATTTNIAQISTNTGNISSLQTTVAGKQDQLTFDNTPTAGSSNPVTSSGIKTYVDGHHDSTKQNVLTAGANITIVDDVISASGAAQVNSDWNATSGVAQILNKPTLATVATSGSYNDLSNKPTIPAAQVNSDWNSTSGVSQILNKPTLATVATSGSYNDLSDQPVIPAAQVNSDWSAVSGKAQILNKPTLATVATSGSYSDLSNQPTIPSKTSDLTNDSGFITVSSVPVTSVNTKTGAVTIDASDVGLGNVNNTSDLNKPISTATQTALNLKEDISNKITQTYWYAPNNEHKSFGEGTTITLDYSPVTPGSLKLGPSEYTTKSFVDNGNGEIIYSSQVSGYIDYPSGTITKNTSATTQLPDYPYIKYEATNVTDTAYMSAKLASDKISNAWDYADSKQSDFASVSNASSATTLKLSNSSAAGLNIKNYSGSNLMQLTTSSVSFGGGSAQVKVPTTPSASNDATSKSYVDTQVGGKQNLIQVIGILQSDGSGEVFQAMFDEEPTYESESLVTSGSIYEWTQNQLSIKQNTIDANGILRGDGTGTITAATVDSTPTSGSSNLITSGAVYTGLDAKQDKLTIKTEIDSPLVKNSEYYLSTESATLTLTTPSGSAGDYIFVKFISGSTPTVLTITTAIGDIPTPIANRTYELFLSYNGENWVCSYIAY